jgi:hypothetical protein
MTEFLKEHFKQAFEHVKQWMRIPSPDVLNSELPYNITSEDV